MTELQQLIEQIKPPSEAAGRQARTWWDTLAKPLGGLGLLEEAVIRIAALTGSVDVSLKRRALLVLCSDNGVVARGVSQSDSGVTAVVARALAEGRSTVCHMARVANCQVIPVDMGILDFTPVPGVQNCRIRNGTADIACGPAMNRTECEAAILAGVRLVGELAEQGVDIIATGEMGIGNTTTSSAVASVLLEQPPARMAGRGAGLSDAGLLRKVEAIRTAIAVNRPDPKDPVDVLSKTGGLDIAGLCGVFLGGALHRVPVLVDGMISGTAALCAARLCPAARGAMLASHVSAEPAGQLLLDALGIKPLITAGMHLGEGTGAVAALPLLDMALAVYHGGNTFDRMGMDAYVPQN